MKKFLLPLLILSSFLTQGQNASIKGKITDSDDLGIPLVNITISGSDEVFNSDLEGNYILEGLNEGEYSLTFSAFGSNEAKFTVALKANEQKILDVKLGNTVLEEIVVVGYGTSLKRDLTGSISSVSSEDLEDALSPSFDQALQGKMAGVQITAANGVAGGGNTKIQIRGTNSIAAGSNPLIVVDGIPISNQDVSADVMGNGANALSDINMDDIASIDVLKDASASAIYGARGANGVILITTKQGKSGKTRFNFNIKSGIVQETNRINLISASEHLAMRDQISIENTGMAEPKTVQLGIYEGQAFTRADADEHAAKGGSDWIDETLQTGFFNEANLSASSGTEKTNMYFSGAYRNEDSFLKGNKFQRIAGRFNIDSRAHDRVTLGANAAVTYTINDRVATGDNGGLGWAQQIPRYIPIYKDDGSYFNPAGNPLWYLENRSFIAKRLRSLTNVYAGLKLHEKVQFRSSFGLDYSNLKEDEYQARNEASNSDAYAWERISNIFNWNVSNYFTYTDQINEIHDINVVLGSDYQRTEINGFGIYGSGFSNASFTNPQQGANQSLYSYQTGNAILSFYSRINYKFKNKYLFNITARVDGSSRFSEQYRYGFFPSFSAGWILSEENFLKDNEILTFLKLRASYGFTGNDNIGDFTRFGVYTTGLGYAGSLALYPASLPNTELRWEKAQMLDVSLEYALLDNRVSGSLTFFHKQSTDLLLPIQLPTSSGFSSITVNAGSVNNWGIEWMLETYNISKKDFKWKTNLNFSLIRNKVIDVSGLPPDAFESGQPGEGRVIEGYPVGQSFVVQFAGVQQQDGNITRYNTDGTVMMDGNGNPVTVSVQAGEALYYDLNGNVMAFGVDNRGTSSSDDDVNRFTGSDFYDNRVPVGNPNPDFYAGISNTLSYKGLELDFLVNFVIGQTIYDDPAKNQIGNYTYFAQRNEILGAYTTDAPSAMVPSIASTTPVNSDRFLYDGSFIRLRSVTLSYSLPKKLCDKINFSSLKIYATGFNLLTWTPYAGWDPEVLRHVPQNSQQENISFSGPSWQTPQARIIMFGIKAGI